LKAVEKSDNKRDNQITIYDTKYQGYKINDYQFEQLLAHSSLPAQGTCQVRVLNDKLILWRECPVIG